MTCCGTPVESHGGGGTDAPRQSVESHGGGGTDAPRQSVEPHDSRGSDISRQLIECVAVIGAMIDYLLNMIFSLSNIFASANASNSATTRLDAMVMITFSGDAANEKIPLMARALL